MAIVPKKNNRTIFLVGLFLGAALLRFLLYFFFTRHGSAAYIYFDSQQYLDIARNLLAGNGFTDAAGVATAYRLPGYPVFLAAGCWLTGSFYGALVLQLLLAATIPLLIFLVARQLFALTPAVAYVTALITCVHVGLVLYAGMFATETLATVLLLLFVLFTLRHSVIAGFLLGALSLVRPVGHWLLLGVLGLGWAMHNLWFRAPLILTWAAIVAPWLIRNVLVVGGLCFHTLPGLHFMQYSVANIIMQRDGIEYAPARKQVLSEWEHDMQQQGLPLSEYARCVDGEKRALTYALEYRGYAMRYSCVQLAKTLCALHSTQLLLADSGTWVDYTSRTTLMDKVKRYLNPTLVHGWLAPLIYGDIATTLFMLVGLFFALLAALRRRRLQPDHLLVWLIILLMWGMTLAYGCARLRLPFEPLLLMYAVYGWWWVWRCLKEKLHVH